MKSSHKKLLGAVMLLLFLVPLSLAVKKVYRELKQPELNAALIAAVKRNDTAAVVSLLREGADANSRDFQPDMRSMWVRLWDTVLRKAVPIGNEHTALLVGLGIYDGGEFPADNPELIKALVDKGATANISDEFGRTPLIWAAMSSKRETVRLLLNRGAQTNTKDNEGYQAIHWAACQDDPNLLLLLLAKGATVEDRGGVGITPLHWAAFHGQIEVARLLIEKGANVNSRDDEGTPPLFYAIYTSHPALLEFLLAKGAQVNLKNQNRESPLNLAQEDHNAKIIIMLKKAGAKE